MEALKDYRAQANDDDPSPYINETDNTVKNAVFEYIANLENERYVSVITGKVGSGKSALLYYISNCYAEELLKNRVVYCDIRYNAKEIERKEFKDGSKWENYFKRKFLDSATNKIVNDAKSHFKNKLEEFPEYFQSYVELILDNKDEINLLKSRVRRLVKGGVSLPVIAKLDKRIKESLVEYMIEEEVSFLVAIDGFDVFSMEEINESTQKAAFNVIAKIISGRFALIECPMRGIRYLITLRACTYELFMDWYSENNHNVNHFKLAPVGVIKILHSRAKRHKEEEMLEDNNLDGFISNMVGVIQRRFGIERDGDLISIFNENYRRLLDYFSDVVVYYSSKIVYEEGKYVLTDFIRSFGHRDLISKYLRSQNLVEILLMSCYSSYRNYYTFPNGGCSIVKDGSIESGRGYIDNIFNYSISGSGPLPYYLIKIRIVQILLVNGKHLVKRKIVEELGKLGYQISDEQIEHYIRLLIAVGFVRPRKDLSGELSYLSTRKGEFLVRRLLSEIRYTENVIQTSLYPAGVAKHLIGCRKYGNVRDGNGWPIVQWIKASIINNYVHAQYITWIERTEKKVGYPDSQKSKIGKDEWSMEVCVDEIKEAVRNIVSSPISGTAVYLDADGLHSEILQIKEKLGKSGSSYRHS